MSCLWAAVLCAAWCNAAEPRIPIYSTAPRVEPPKGPPPSIFNVKPTTALLKDLHARLAAADPHSTASKLNRIELAARLIQVDLALGGLGSGEFDHIDIEPGHAADARQALRQMPLKDLNDLSRPATRAVLWSAIGSAHPLYRLYVEAARLAGHTDDERVLDRTLRMIKEGWNKPAKEKETTTIAELHLIDDETRNRLVEMLNYQEVSCLEDAARLMRDVVAAPQTHVHRAPGPTEPTAREPRALHTARLHGGLDQFDKLAHLGAALQRAGFDVTFWSLAVFVAVDEGTKTLVDEPLLVFPARTDEPARIAMGDDGLLSQLGGEELGVGVYLFPNEDALQAVLVGRGQVRLEMRDVLEAQPSLIGWSEALQKSLEKSKSETSLRKWLLELSNPAPWSTFAAQANASLLEQGQARFIEQLRRNQAKLEIKEVLKGDIVAGKFVADLAKRGEDEILTRHEAALGRSFQVLPMKMSPKIALVTLQSKPIKEKIATAVLENGKVTVKDVERLVPGRAGPHRIYLASANLAPAIHENIHAWALARFERFEVGEWKGNCVDPFNNISWEQGGGRAWERRGTDRIRLEDYLWDYGATNQNEDLAVVGQYYVLYPKHFRDTARAQLQRGNLTPALKYLYLKYVAFLDLDGQCLEYGIDKVEDAYTLDEFENRVLALERAGGVLTEEQQRLRDLARLIGELYRQMLENQRIVSSLDLLPLTDV